MVRTAAIAAMVSVPAVRCNALRPAAMGAVVAIVTMAAMAHQRVVAVEVEIAVIGPQVTMDEAAATAKTVSRVRPAKVAAGLN